MSQPLSFLNQFQVQPQRQEQLAPLGFFDPLQVQSQGQDQLDTSVQRMSMLAVPGLVVYRPVGPGPALVPVSTSQGQFVPRAPLFSQIGRQPGFFSAFFDFVQQRRGFQRV